LHAEWTKFRTARSCGWALVGVAVLMSAVGVLAVWSLDFDVCASVGGRCDLDITKLTLTGAYVSQFAAVIPAVLVVTDEYADGMIRTTLAATPSRGQVFLAKGAVVVSTVLGAALLGVAASLAAGRQVLTAHGFTADHGYPPLSFADGLTLRAAAGTVLYLGLIALMSFGLASVLRDTAASLATVLSLLLIFPILSGLVTDPHWREALTRYSPMSAGLSIQVTRDPSGLAIQPWAGLGVLALYAVAASLLGYVLFAARDA
jgi:ABC-2 type transport system permease protein